MIGQNVHTNKTFQLLSFEHKNSGEKVYSTF